MALLSTTTLTQITQAIKVAKLFGVETLIVDVDKIRGVNNARTIGIYDENLSIDIEGSIGINRIDVLSNRLSLLEGKSDYVVDCVIDEKTGDTKSLVMKTNRAKVEYRCARLKSMKAPNKIDDRIYKFEIDEDVVSILTRADSAMRADTLCILCDDNNITYQFMDANGDVFQYESATKMINLIDDAPINMVREYPVKLIMLAIKNNTTGNFYITEKKVFNADINGINVYITSKQ